MIDRESIEKLYSMSSRVRQYIIEQVYKAGSGHIGGSLSCTDILVALYFHVMNVKPKEPLWIERDRFVLSKGHCSPALYGVLAERGYFPISELERFRSFQSYLEGHPCMLYTPGVDMTTGSLGQGLSAAVGMAMDAKCRGRRHRVFAILGDGELQEGQVWESSMCAAHYHLNNLYIVIDNNGLQIDGTVNDIMNLGDIKSKFKAFGWNAIDVDGHDIKMIISAFEEAENNTLPSVIIAKTVKGKGVSFMENSLKWHGTAPSLEDRKNALAEIQGELYEENVFNQTSVW